MEFTCWFYSWSTSIWHDIGSRYHERAQNPAWLQGPNNDLGWLDYQYERSLPDLLDPVNVFFWSNNLYETKVLQEASTRLQKILDAKYTPVDLNAVIQACRHLTEDEKSQLHALLRKYELVFDGTLWTALCTMWEWREEEEEEFDGRNYELFYMTTGLLPCWCYVSGLHT